MSLITRREFIKKTTVMTAAALTSAGNLTDVEIKKQKYPNLIFVFPDEFRRQAIGFMNEDPVITPNLDRVCITRSGFN